MLEGIISPRIKNKFGNKNDSSNYREVMISSNLFKCLEYIILPYIKENFELSEVQYGYRGKTSTIMAIGTLKEALRNYIQKKNVVYGCFMDMSRAFERVNHNLLISKIRASNIPVFIANIVQSILSSSSACVNFNGHFSNNWQLSRGVRQGGVLSAHLYSIYVNEILEKISKEPYGIYLGI